MENGIRDKIERLKLKAEEILKERLRCFIIDVFNNYYFCDILFVGENYLVVQDFKGLRKFEKSRLWWADVVKLEPYKEREKK
jgi:hypothetical protein